MQASNNICPKEEQTGALIPITAPETNLMVLFGEALTRGPVKAFLELGPGHRHDSLCGVASSVKRLCDSEDTLYELLIKIYEKAVEKTGGEVDEVDCQNTARHIWNEDGDIGTPQKKSSGRRANRINKDALYAKLQEEALPRVAAWAMTDDADRYDFPQHSSSNDTPASVINDIMLPCLMENEYIWCSDSLTSAKDPHAFHKAGDLACIPNNVLYFVPNPLASQSRTDDAVRRIMFCPIESDSELAPVDSPEMSEQWMNECKRQQQVYFGRLAKVFSFVLVTYSGCKSLHGLVAVDASKDEWDRSRPTLIGLYIALGLDIAMLNPSRCTRVPQGMRYFYDDNGKWADPKPGMCLSPAENKLERMQEVLYKDPDAERWSLQQYIEALRAIAVEMHGEEWTARTIMLCEQAEEGVIGVEAEDAASGDDCMIPMKHTEKGRWEFNPAEWDAFCKRVGLGVAEDHTGRFLVIRNDKGYRKAKACEAFSYAVHEIAKVNEEAARMFRFCSKQQQLNNEALTGYAGIDIRLNLPHDTRDMVFAPFANGMVVITAEGITLKENYMGYDTPNIVEWGQRREDRPRIRAD